MKKAGVLVLLVFASFSYFLISSKPVWATPGVWSSSGSNMYYNDGAIGLGTSTPISKLNIVGGADPAQDYHLMTLEAIEDRGWNISVGKYNQPTRGSYALVISQPVYDGCAGCLGDIQFKGGKNFNITMNGNVGIGTGLPTQKLSVNGTVLAKEVIVSSAASYWPDYVFDNEYNLMSLDDLKSYVDMNKHLPNIPNQDEIEKNGVSVGEMQKLQMEKIEELTLYILQLKEENEELKMQNEDLKNRIGKVESLFNI